MNPLAQLRRFRTGGDDPDLTIERHFTVGPDDVWDALTDPQRASRWLAPIAGRPRMVGDDFDVEVAPDAVAHARVLSCSPPVSFVVAWDVFGEPASQVAASLRPEGGGTVLTIRHRRVRADFFAASGSGWETALVTLAASLDGSADAVDLKAWTRLSASGLRVVRDLPADPARVWSAFTSAQGLATWWWTHWDDVRISADVRPGGSYRIQAPQQGIVVEGTYLDVEPDHHLAFTWCWRDADGASVDEACDLRLEAAAGGTRLTLTHTGPWTGGEAESYRQGWDFTLAALNRVLAG
jgi:uncharacterized protein YndB with AHSA1/START domain